MELEQIIGQIGGGGIVTLLIAAFIIVSILKPYDRHRYPNGCSHPQPMGRKGNHTNEQCIQR